MTDSQLSAHITEVIEKNLNATQGLNEISDVIVQKLKQLGVTWEEQKPVFVTGFTKNTEALPLALEIKTPLFAGKIRLQSAGDKYWYVNSDGGMVISQGNMKATWKRLKKYGAV